MAFKMKPSAAGGDFEPAPAGAHRAVCIQVLDMGTQETAFGPKRQARLTWEIDEKMDNGLPFIVSKLYTMSLNEKANLRKDIESWRGKALNDDEEFDVTSVAGKSCMLTIVHNEKDQKRYANVSAVSKLPKGMEPMDSVGKVIVIDLDTSDWGDRIGDLPDWLQERILKSPESKGIDPSKQPSVSPQKAPTGTVGPEVEKDFDDDIPF